MTLSALLFGAAATRGEGLGPFDAHQDVGQPALPGDATFDAASQTFTLRGAGANMWDRSDQFQFAWRKMKGDFQIVAEAALGPKSAKSNVHRKLGVMIRQSLDADAPYADVAVHGDGLTSLQYRPSRGEVTSQTPAATVGAQVVKLSRKGRKIAMQVAWLGEPFGAERSVELDLGDEVYVGVYLCSHDEGVVETGSFRNVRISVPAPDDFRPYRDYIGSDLEILDVDTGRREIVYHAPGSIQAPNWTTDGKALIYNAEGKLYRFDLATRTPSVIDSGEATANNNDHVLSFDGRQLGISHHDPADGGRSHVFVMPAEGGTPRRVTMRGPSYFHGWSPDGKTLTYTGDRDGKLDIYTIPVDGGEEVQLTRESGLNDGPEYAPDGSRIYFNSTRTGRMQLWRMYPNGYDQEQVTDDGFNNWFPHISPDATRIAFLSFLPDVDPRDHPFYKQVYLRVMPYPGGPARVVAYVYGGQGSINVPSWSPDGKRLAFVSNTAGP